MVTYRLTAPLRIDFCGGFTDVQAIGRETGVGVCSTAVDLYHDPARRYRVGFGMDLSPGIMDGGWPGGYRATIRAISGDAAFQRAVALRSDLPDSTGLGSSGAMTVMLVAALELFHGNALPAPLDLVRRAHAIESGALAFTTGHQDHVAAASGQSHFIDRLLQDTAAIAPFPLPDSFAEAIDADTLIVCAARSQSSAAILNDIIERMHSDRAVYDALTALRECNETLYRQLRAGESDASLFEVIGRASRLRDTLSPRMAHAVLDELRSALTPWVFATHASGAGGGAFVAYCRPGSLVHALALLSPMREAGVVRVWFPKVNRRGLWVEHLE